MLKTKLKPSLFKTKNQNVRTMYGDKKKPSKLKIQKQSEDIIIKRKEIKAIKDRIIRDIRTLFKQQGEYYYKLVRVGNF